jgi:aspartate/methionine/tyrosine aminotransferase
MAAEHFVSRRAQSVDASGIRKMFDLGATLKDPINFSIGQPDYDVPEAIKQAAIQAIQQGRNGYTPTQGIAPLVEKIRAGLRAEFNGYDPGVFVTSGVSGGLTLAMLACLNPGDEVIVPDPYFVSYKHLANLLGARPVFLDTYPDFHLPGDRLAAAITPRTRMLLLNSPCNPTGVVFSKDELALAAELARKHDLLVVTDEIYRDLNYEGPNPSVVAYAPERTILLRGFGKSYGMTGWRMGFAAGPPALIAEMGKLQQYTFVLAPSIVQYAGLVALDTPVDARLKEYRQKRDLVVRLLSGSFEFSRPGGAFYVFPKAPPRFANATEFVTAAMEHDVLCIPGGIFSERDTHLRISYAVPDDKIKQGCEILCRLAQGA